VGDIATRCWLHVWQGHLREVLSREWTAADCSCSPGKSFAVVTRLMFLVIFAAFTCRAPMDSLTRFCTASITHDLFIVIVPCVSNSAPTVSLFLVGFAACACRATRFTSPAINAFVALPCVSIIGPDCVSFFNIALTLAHTRMRTQTHAHAQTDTQSHARAHSSL
jgi:hypothetical protein